MTQALMASVPVGLLVEAAAAGQPMAVCVYGALDGFYGGCIAGIWPGINRLAVQLDVSRSTVKRALSWLAAEGWVTVTRRVGADGRQTTNGYRLHDDAPNRRDLDDDAVHARFMAAAARALYARASDAEPGDPVENPDDAVPVRDGSDRFAWGVTDDPGPGSQMTHNPYLPSRSNWAASSTVVDNPDPDPGNLEGVNLTRLHIASSYAALGLSYQPLRPVNDR